MKEINNTTIYTKENIKKFLEVYYFDKTKKIRIIMNIFIILLIVYFFRKPKPDIIDKITFAFALFGIIELNTNLLPRLNYYKLTKSKNNNIDSKIKYTFKKRNFKLTNDKDEYIDYSELRKVIETKDCYYLYITINRALIVDKSSFNKENINVLTNIFKQNVSTYIYKK